MNKNIDMEENPKEKKNQPLHYAAKPKAVGRPTKKEKIDLKVLAKFCELGRQMPK